HSGTRNHGIDFIQLLQHHLNINSKDVLDAKDMTTLFLNKKFCSSLNDEQISIALVFILEVTKNIITRKKEVNNLSHKENYSLEGEVYNSWS
ncbi:34428_t:CDS:2, partial [Gigaspora margarita]